MTPNNVADSLRALGKPSRFLPVVLIPVAAYGSRIRATAWRESVLIRSPSAKSSLCRSMLKVSGCCRRNQSTQRTRRARVTPSHQYPLGVTDERLSAASQLLDWGRRVPALWIRRGGRSRQRLSLRKHAHCILLQGLDANSRVIYIGTFSKVLFPSLRLGYLVIPR